MTGVESPFSPGKPVESDLFVGREEEIVGITRFLRQCASGRNENILITGERGFGKSSLARITSDYAVRELEFASVYCQLTRAATIEEACTLIAEQLLAQIPKQSLAERAKAVFGRYIESVSLGFPGIGLQVRFRTEAGLQSDLKLHFPSLIDQAYQQLQPEVKGLVIVLDDLNGVTKDPGFAHFLKGWVDEIVTSGRLKIPLAIVLVGTQEKMAELMKHQPSVGRIFRPFVIQRIADSEVEEFFRRAFASVNITVEEVALKYLRFFSGGVPLIMHEVGDATFWTNNDGAISSTDAIDGVFAAAKQIGLKYVEPQVVRKIRSASYRQIMKALATVPRGVFKRQALLKAVAAKDKPRVDSLLGRLEELGMIRKTTEATGEYEFIHTLHQLYLRLIFPPEAETRKLGRGFGVE
jgi:DNA replication protein DnaC